jgi:hypothetical protein
MAAFAKQPRNKWPQVRGIRISGRRGGLKL